MIKMQYEEVISKIKEKTKLDDHEIQRKIDDKLTELSGLISKHGAAHIIANELGVNLYEQTTGRLKVKNILAGMRNVEIAGKVQSIFELREFNTGTKQGKVRSMMIGDETGAIRVVLWNDQTDKISQVKADD